MMRNAIFFFLFFFTGSVFACTTEGSGGGTCPTQEFAYSTCESWVSAHQAGFDNFGLTVTCEYSTVANTAYRAKDQNGGFQSNPWTWTISCPAGEEFNETTHLCAPPVDCQWPESDNGFGECEIEECQSFELRDSVTGSCFTPPSCAATEFVNLETHECQLAPLRCPFFSHANATNDACLPDPPLACPQGQHDDGTYHCVADDAKSCASNEQMGYIDGIPQCIKKVNADQAAADASAADAAAAAAKAAADAAAATAAQAAADSAAAQAAAAAEPENQALQDAAQAAVQTSLDAAAAATAANTAATEAAAAADLERDKAQTELLKSIEENTSHEGEEPSAASVLDALGGAETETIETTGLANLDDVGLGVTRSCPSPKSYNVMGAQLVIDITAFCDIASIIGNIVMIGAAFFSLRILTMG